MRPDRRGDTVKQEAHFSPSLTCERTVTFQTKTININEPWLFLQWTIFETRWQSVKYNTVNVIICHISCQLHTELQLVQYT